jgi:hypothetical protein
MRRQLRQAADQLNCRVNPLVEKILKEVIDQPAKYEGKLEGAWNPNSPDGTITVPISQENKSKLRKMAEQCSNSFSRFTPFVLKKWLEKHGHAPER